MNIYINGDVLEYSLEGEQNLDEVLESLSKWLEQSGMLIRSLYVDEEAIPLYEEKWKQTPIDSVQNISIIAVDISEGRMIQIETAKDYFKLLITSIRNKDEVFLGTLIASYCDIHTILSNVLQDEDVLEDISHIDTILRSPSLVGNPDIEERAIKEISKMMSLLDSKFLEFTDAEQYVDQYAQSLIDIAGDLDKVAIQLQTGKDRIAMGIIIRLTELLQSFLRCAKWMEYEETITQFTEDLSSILNELEEALKSNDTVLIGDLLEYEIKPRLLDIPQKITMKKDALL